MLLLLLLLLLQLPEAAVRCRNPAAWDAYCKFIEDTSSDWERERTNLLGAYHTRLTSGDSALQNAAASAFVACTPTRPHAHTSHSCTARSVESRKLKGRRGAAEFIMLC